MEQQAEKVVYAYATKGGQRVGCVVVLEADDGELYSGWSLCRKGDAFRKDLARQIALNRARLAADYHRGVPGALPVRLGGSRHHAIPQTLMRPLAEAARSMARRQEKQKKGEYTGPRD